MNVNEAAQLLIEALQVELADREDTNIIPVRSIVADLAEQCHVDPENYNLARLPEWETVGWLRHRMREAIGELCRH